MSRRCKPGMRAKIIGTGNAGAIVVVVRRYYGEDVGEGSWPNVLQPWVVTSLSGPLRSTYLATRLPAPPSMTIVCSDRNLEPLRDDDDDDSDVESLPRSTGRPEKAPAVAGSAAAGQR